MPQAIITKYLPATNTRGSRIKASCERGSITIDYPHELSGDSAHIAAANALVAKFAKEDAAKYGSNTNPWSAPRVCGGIDNGRCAHVYSDFNGNAVIGCSDQGDFQRLIGTAKRCKTNGGQIPPLYSGLLGSLFARANV